MRPAYSLSFALVIFAVLVSPPSFAASHSFDSLTTLQSAINAAVPGDTLILKNGIYTTTQPIIVDRSGDAGQPLTIEAESIGGVEITGTHGFDVTGHTSHVVIAGFKFTHASGRNSIDEGTSHVRFTRNTFLCTGDGAYLSIAGDDAQIDYNEFGAKKSAGSMIAVSGIGSQVARRLWIHHNYFHDLTNSGGDGAQMIRLGLMSAHGQSIGAALVEHNLFSSCRGVSELISNRSSGNTYRYNTLLDSPTSQLTLRQGNDCAVYGNYFRNTEGLRIYGDRHQIHSNYFEGNFIAIAIGNGAPDEADGTPNSHDRPDDCVIAFNTFIENATHYTMSRRKPEGLGATNTTFANNIIQGGGTVVRLGGPYTGGSWSGNLLWNTTKIGDLPTEGYTQADPLLEAGADTIKRPQAGSPAIDAATGSFPGVAFDLDGQPRPEKKSLGADEVSTAPVTARLLSAADVGPMATEMPADPAADAATPPLPASAPAGPASPENSVPAAVESLPAATVKESP